MNNDIKKLISEFIAEGATENEAEELAYFAKNFSNSVNIQRSHLVKTKFISNLDKYPQQNVNFFRKHVFASFLSVLFLFGAATVVGAQGSLPGQPLYPVKRVVEKALVAISPSYKANIVKVRSEEIKNISGDSNTQNINKAVMEYENQLKDTPAISIDKLDESKRNLEDAASVSSELNKTVLENAINETEQRRQLLEGKDVKGIETQRDQKERNTGENVSNHREQ